MGGKDGNRVLVAERRDAARVIRVLMGDQYCREITGPDVEPAKAGLRLLQSKPAVDEDQLSAEVDEGTVAPASAAQGRKCRQLANSRIMISSC